MISPPHFYLIEQTNVCQLRCPCCPHRLKQRPEGYMPHDLFRQIVDDILAHDHLARGRRMALHGFGEPLLSPDLWANLDYLESKNFTEVDFSTNGMALGVNARERLAKYRCLSWIRVSINSSRKELMETINEGSDFDRVVANFRAMVTMNAHARVITQLMRTRQNESESLEECRGVFGDVPICVKTLDTLGHSVEEHALAYPATVQPGCYFANNSWFIHWDGDVVGCCIDNTKSQVICNARDGLFTPAMEARIIAMRQQLAAQDFAALPFCKMCYGR